MRRIQKTSLLVLTAISIALPSVAAECRRYGLSVVVDGQPLAEYHSRDRTYVEATKGKNFTLRVSNPTPERVAVALSVDGRNVVDAKRTSAGQAAKWILSPGQAIEIPGWQVSGETARQFFFTDVGRSYAKWLGDTANVGTIEAVFYRERRPLYTQPVDAPLPIPMRKERSAVPQPSAAPQSSAGSVYGAAPAAPPPAAAAKADSALRMEEAEGLAATGIGEKTSFPVRWVDFDEEKAPAARIALRYEYRRELVRLGVLSQREDLWGRDHSRGFEPDYAPDPYRHRAQ